MTWRAISARHSVKDDLGGSKSADPHRVLDCLVTLKWRTDQTLKMTGQSVLVPAAAPDGVVPQLQHHSEPSFSQQHQQQQQGKLAPDKTAAGGGAKAVSPAGGAKGVSSLFQYGMGLLKDAYNAGGDSPGSSSTWEGDQEDPGERVEAEDDGFPGFRSVSPARGVSATTPARMSDTGKIKSLVHKGEVGFGRNCPPCHRHAFCTLVS